MSCDESTWLMDFLNTCTKNADYEEIRECN